MDPGTTSVSVFFYGLFMDSDLLSRKGISASNPRIARLDGYRLHVGSRATLVPALHHTVYGVLMHVPGDDLRRLYSEPDVSAYRPEAVRVAVHGGQGKEEAVCYNLPPLLQIPNGDSAYARELHGLAKRLGLPEEYVERIQPNAQAGCSPTVRGRAGAA